MNNDSILSNEAIRIAVSAHGAELCSIKKDGKEYLWQADPQYWKRHSPVLFPIVGSVWENRYRCEGNEYTLTQHGFARDKDFRLVSRTDNEVWYLLTDDEETRSKYPYAFELRIGYRIEGSRIDVMWRVKNPSDREMHFQIGAHPAFYFPDYQPETSGRGYFSFNRTEGLKYILISEKGCADPDTEYDLQLTDGLLPMDIHTFDRDALILQDGQVNEVTLHNNRRQPVLKLHFDTAPLVGLWSPPAKNAPFVCIEPWYGRCDRAHYAGDYADKDWMQHLAAGDTFEGGYSIEIVEEVAHES